MNAFLTSWKTSAMGALALLCAGSELTGLMPEKWSGVMNGVCMILVSLGVIAAKDANVSHSPKPTSDSHHVPSQE